MRRSVFIALLVLMTLFAAQKVASECGEVQVSFGLVASGNKSHHGEWPWLVSLHEKQRNGPDKFFCGASLINEWTMVTAAHCIRERRVQAKHVRALLGRLNITDETEKGWTRRNISAIKVHENFGASAFADSGIAVLILDEAVQFTNYIQPICLPSFIDDANNKVGMVVGYENVNKTSNHQSVPSHAVLRTISPYDCTYDPNANRKASKTVAFNSFCAKSSVSVPCVGDSGGPFMVRSGNVWTLFGVVSYAFNTKCNARDFVVFADVTKFADWILSNSGSFNCIVGSKRVPWVKYCDGVSDCDDGSDERHCVSGEIKRSEVGSRLLAFYSSEYTQIDDEDYGIASARDESVEGFYLSNEDVKFLPILMDEKFPNLKEFWAYFCSVQKISSENFKNLKKLEELFLFGNEISSIEANSFAELNSLKGLYLSGNKLKEVDANWFRNLVNLNELSLGDNQITSLPENAFENLSELKEINLDGNQLKSLPAQLFKNNKKLVTISLHSIQIEEIPSNFFAGLTELEDLDLSGNQISNLTPNVFKDLTKLSRIYLERNFLKVLSKEVFQFNKKLENIRLRSNQLEKIDEKLFDGMKNLKWVDLRENKCIDREFGDSSTFNLLELKSEVKAKCN